MKLRYLSLLLIATLVRAANTGIVNPFTGRLQLINSSGGGSSLPLPGGATNYIQVTNSLQSSSTFYVSSGTSNNFNTTSLRVGDIEALSGLGTVTVGAAIQTSNNMAVNTALAGNQFDVSGKSWFRGNGLNSGDDSGTVVIHPVPGSQLDAQALDINLTGAPASGSNYGIYVNVAAAPVSNYAMYVKAGNINLQPLTATRLVMTDINKNLISTTTLPSGTAIAGLANTVVAVDANGAFISTTVASGGTPGGSSGQIQYNSGGSFGGIPGTFIGTSSITFSSSSIVVVSTVSLGSTTTVALVNIGSNTTTNTGGLEFGTDTNLYRDNPNSLRTGGAFTVMGVTYLNTSLNTGELNVSPYNSGADGIAVRGLASQTGNLIEAQLVSGTSVFAVGPLGNVSINTSTNTPFELVVSTIIGSTTSVNSVTISSGSVVTVSISSGVYISTDGLVLQTLEPAQTGLQRKSPALHFKSNGFATGTSTSVVQDVIIQGLPSQSSASVAELQFQFQVNGGGYFDGPVISATPNGQNTFQTSSTSNEGILLSSTKVGIGSSSANEFAVGTTGAQVRGDKLLGFASGGGAIGSTPALDAAFERVSAGTIGIDNGTVGQYGGLIVSSFTTITSTNTPYEICSSTTNASNCDLYVSTQGRIGFFTNTPATAGTAGTKMLQILGSVKIGSGSETIGEGTNGMYVSGELEVGGGFRIDGGFAAALNQGIGLTGSANTTMLYKADLNGDSNTAFSIQSLGDMWWGSGTQMKDVGLGRVSTGTLSIYDGFTNTNYRDLILRGISASSMTIIASTSTAYEFSSSTSSTFFHVHISTAGHYITGGTAPIISACGTTPNGSVAGTDQGGTITVGGGVVTSCTLTFNMPYGVTPDCTVSDNNAAVGTAITSVSATAITFGTSATLAGGTLTYRCGCDQGASCL